MKNLKGKGVSKMDWRFPYHSQRMPVLARNTVAASQPLAAQAGLDVLRKGGNAVDAALAAAITLTVVEPTGTGIGGDLFAVLWDGKKLHGINGSGRSPRAWNDGRFRGLTKMPDLGWDTVTVPGAVRAWADLSERFGRLPFKALFVDAVRYAEEGFLVTPRVAEIWAEAPSRYRAFSEFGKTFLPDGKAPRAGERFKCRELAQTLAELADTKGKNLYEGRLAERIAAFAKSTGGAITEEDLASHRSEWVEPLSVSFAGADVHELPPNGQGIAALIALGILRHLRVEETHPDGAKGIHLQVEAMRQAFRVCFEHLGDPVAMRIDPEALIEEGALGSMAKAVSMERASGQPPVVPAGGGTVYLAAADRNGMMVSLIQSNYFGFGSGIVVPETGIALHNRGCGFNTIEGHPNCVAGGKRPFHTIIPGFVMREGRPLMAFGVMGAHMQPQGHVQMLVRILCHGMNPQAASDAPRWHLFADGSLGLEEGFDESIRDELRRKGHRIIPMTPRQVFGGAQAILAVEGGYIAASDHRKDGQAVGF
jgi:gamma-glutamyltranspeptidase/glutathione hydrolase